MNSVEIEQLLYRNPVTCEFFKGCYPCDQIPLINLPRFAFCVNLGKAGTPGFHWVGIFKLENDVVCYFDSSGAKPPTGPILKWLQRFRAILYNPYAHQSLFSRTCGGFVCWFIFMMSSGCKFEELIALLENMSNDDHFIIDFMSKKFGYKLRF